MMNTVADNDALFTACWFIWQSAERT